MNRVDSYVGDSSNHICVLSESIVRQRAKWEKKIKVIFSRSLGPMEREKRNVGDKMIWSFQLRFTSRWWVRRASLKILFLIYLCSGPMNQSMGPAHLLKQRGHQVSFVLNQQWKGKLAPFGFQEYFLDSQQESTSSSNEDFWSSYIEEALPKFCQSTFDQIKSYFQLSWKTLIDDGKSDEVYLEKLFHQTHFGLIIQNHNVCYPILTRCSMPWIRFVSLVQSIGNAWWWSPTDLPGSLFVRSEWLDAISKRVSSGHRSSMERVSTMCRTTIDNSVVETSSISMSNPDMETSIFIPSKLIRAKNDLWTIDGIASIRPFDRPMTIFNCLNIFDTAHPPHRWLMSLWDLASADFQLMTRVIDLLSRTCHYFIIRKGSSRRDLKLSEPMIGECSLPQPQILPLVDLFIAHGGNKTITETLHFGEPMIVLPVLWDQYDNAQRMQDLNFGWRFDTYSFADEEFLSTIEELLQNEKLREKMNQIGENIRQRQDVQFAVATVERIAQQHRKTLIEISFALSFLFVESKTEWLSENEFPELIWKFTSDWNWTESQHSYKLIQF